MNVNKITILHFLCFLLVAVCLSSCEKVLDASNNDWKNIDCDNLKIGILTTDSQIVKSEIDKLLTDLHPVVTSDDNMGHKHNMDTLIARLNNQCNIVDAELICYACIETYPPQSEIRVTTDSIGTTISRTIDISTPEDSNLNCVRIHK